MANITSLIVKIGAQDAEITAALAKLGSNVKRTEAEFKKLGSTPVAQQAQQSLKTLDDTVKQITTSQQRLADRAKVAAAGLTAIGGPARVTKNELEQINRTIQSGLDAYRALGQQAPKELQKVADAVAKQRKELAGGGAGGGDLTGLLGSLGISTGLLTGAGVVAALGGGAKAALDYADSLTKLSDRTGITTYQLQRLDAVAGASGNSVEQVADAVNQFQKRFAGGEAGVADALAALGVNAQQLKVLAPEEQFFAIAKAIQTIQDPAEQTRLAMELFGKSGAQLLPTLKADIDGLKDSTFNMSIESVKALDDFGDAMGRLKSSAVGVLGELAASAIQLVGSLAQFPEVLKKAQEAAANRAPGERAPNVSIPGMLGQVQGNLPAGITPAQLQALIRGETAVAPAAPVAPQIAAIAPAAIEASRALALLNAGLADEVTKATAASAAAQRASEAHKKWADNFAAVTEQAKGFGVVVDTIDGAVVEGVKYYVDRGVAIGKVGEVYGLTAVQVDALSEKFAFEAKLATASAAIHAKLATEVYNVDTAFEKLQGRPLTKIPVLQSGPNAQLAALQVDNLGKKIDGAAQAFAILAQVSGNTFGGMSREIGLIVSQMNALQQSAQAFGVNLSNVNAGIISLGLNVIGYLAAAQAKEDQVRAAIGAMTQDAMQAYGEQASRLIGSTLTTAYIDAINHAHTLAEAQRAVNDLLAAMAAQQSLINDANAIVGPSQTQLEDAAARAREILDLVTSAGQRDKNGNFTPDYTAEQQAKAYYNWQRAMADAGNAAAKAWVAAHDAADNATASASKAIDDLRAKRDGLAQSISNEAPEDVMGVIEAQIRGQIAALDAQLNAQQDAVDENTTQATDAAATVQDTFKNCWTQVGQDGKSAADAIADYFGDLDVVVKVRYDLSGNPIPGAATGGRVTANGIQRFAAGGVVLPFLPRGTDTVPAMLTPGEIVLNAAQQRAVAGQLGGGPSVGAINVAVYPAAGEDEQALAARVVSALRTNSVLYEAVSVVSKRAVA